MQKSGNNHGGYHGETVDICAVLRETESAARQHGWTAEVFHERDDFKWLALQRKPEARSQKSEEKWIFVKIEILNESERKIIYDDFGA